ncbi:MarR family winged helix-turn-helix transcriptional regulator [Sphingomonas sp.]|jgi:DNA-binding MarR family transcriptional regulator|uniref:MarR family winged helix-turn-helix transcriptional regulator n=1 Tax=Sphingomonas sp. TaxID=28214 RepID=UPI002DEBEDED|nr:MarR family winged helix-turn-helix transcriptional regulator [Sphingomonas sp.]
MQRTTLGVLLRHLLDLLDGDVEVTYRAAGLDYRPRFTPVVRHLAEVGSGSIRTIAEAAGITHSAASQTVAEMTRKGLVVAEPGADGRERIIALSAVGVELVPALRTIWSATNAAAEELDREVGGLHEVLGAAIEALSRRPYRDRIAARLPSAGHAVRESVIVRPAD